MKIIFVFSLMFAFCLTSIAQEDSTQKLPPLHMLPKKGKSKRIYELTQKAEYKIYDSDGKLVEDGNAEFIDITAYKKGTYFIQYDGKKESFSCE